jgi:hypothetical protein
MTIIQTRCPQCGTENSVPAGALLATVSAQDLDPEYAGTVAWICAGCDQVVHAPVAWHAFLALFTAGVAMLEEDGDLAQDTDLPPHPEQPPAGHAFTPDDLLELHELLAGDTWFSALAATSQTPC